MIKYKIGDATNPTEKPAILLHIVNNLGIAGAGIAKTISNKFPLAIQEYKYNFKSYTLGDVCFSKVTDNLWIAHMFGQKGIGQNEFGMPPIRYDSLEECLWRVKDYKKKLEMMYTDNQNQYIKLSLVGPKFGAGLSMGSWFTIEQIIDKVGLDIIIYELPILLKTIIL